MNAEIRRAILAIPIALMLAVGLAWAGSQYGVAIAGVPVFILALSTTFLIQWIVFIPSYIGRTEHYFDLTGGLTYIFITLLVLWLSPRDGRAYLLSILVLIWAGRLGSFLYQRVRIAGEDRRFREIKQSFVQFLTTWTLQGLWVSITAGAAWAAISASEKVPLGIPAYLGTTLWLLGFSIEVIADYQKRRFRSVPANKGKFIQSGLWAWSRHPNYFGEVILWVGIAVIAAPALVGWQYLTLVSPLFVYLLISRISGVNLLENAADEKWGGQQAYEVYKAQTPLLVPLPPRKR